jgi:hypothetical protein
MSVELLLIDCFSWLTSSVLVFSTDVCGGGDGGGDGGSDGDGDGVGGCGSDGGGGCGSDGDGGCGSDGGGGCGSDGGGGCEVVVVVSDRVGDGGGGGFYRALAIILVTRSWISPGPTD